MPDEIESKIRVTGHDPIRQRLRQSGAEYLGRVLETNRLFDDSNGSLLDNGCGLRVRACDLLDGAARSATLTYKGPMREGVFKKRVEVEVAISDAAAMMEILGSLGFHPRIVFEKRRESWRFKGCAVELDEVPNLGLFVEVEGPDEESIHSVLSGLGLDALASIRTSYVTMLVSGEKPEGGMPFEFRFAPES
ncbi:MAG: class IV adenylate cyclase [Planctomycetota bacterium]